MKVTRFFSGLVMLLLAVGTLASCATYGYTLITHNETTARLRDHEIVGSVTLEVKPTKEMFEEEKGVRAILLEKARMDYGNEVDDVVNISVSQTYAWQNRYFIAQGDAIVYTEAM